MMTSRNDRRVLDIIFDPEYSGTTNDDQPNGHHDAAEEELTSEADVRARQLEIEAVKAAERGQLDEALKLFDDAIAVAPTRASCYNNRAQARRLKGDTINALDDLNQAVTYSGGTGKAGTNALCQRALLLRLNGKEEEAMADFERAAKNGHQFAKTQLVKLNPYAALCNQMLGDMMSALQRGEPLPN